MTYVAVGVALLLWGALVGRTGQKVGTVLAVIPVVAWFEWPDNLDSPGSDALPAYLLIGLFAFLVGSNLTSRSVAVRTAPKQH